MKINEEKLTEILLRQSYVSEADLEGIAASPGVSLVDYLLSKSLLTKDLLGQAIAESFEVPYADLNSKPPAPTLVVKIPEDLARRLRVVLIEEQEGSVTVASDSLPSPDLSPELQELLPQLQELFSGKMVHLAYALEEDIDACFVHYQKPLETRFTKILEKKDRIAPELLEEIFEDARVYRASDIHFEPRRNEILVRFRVDGVLRDAGRIPKEHYDNMLNRIKVKSSLRIDEHHSAQDGSLRYEKDSIATDMRTSILPTVEGEKVVLRVLGSYLKGLSLTDIGLSEADQVKVTAAAEKPFGMILVIGPTGSGKTTMLYSILGILNNSTVNITTIEDPVEYKVETVNQIQVNNETGLTFAKGLRSIVRQDPDIILVGEIRDSETAEIAVNASLTGHLLLSTFHANDAATALPRLREMGIEPFLLASTIQLLVAQRLYRKICDNCRISTTWTESDFNTPQLRASRGYFPGDIVTLYKGKGCAQCNNSGYKGRSAIFECITMSPALQELILRSPSSQEIWELARKEGARSMFEDGVDKVKNGMTTLEELLRVAEPPADAPKAPLAKQTREKKPPALTTEP